METHGLRHAPKERCSVVRLFRLENILTIAIIAAALGVSRILLQRKSYRLHGILLLFLALGTTFLLFCAGEDSYAHPFILFFALFYLAVDHYWARKDTGETAIPLQTVRTWKIVLAVVFTIWAVLAYLDFFSHVQRFSLLCIAALLWLDNGFQNMDPRRKSHD